MFPHIDHEASRPIFEIKVLGERGTALIDTAAKRCVAGHSLYALLKSKNQQFRPVSMRVKLADGFIQDLNLLEVDVTVNLKHKSFMMPFIIFPDSNNNDSLLGIDFLTAAGIVIDFTEKTWHFSDSPSRSHQLLYEGQHSAPVTSCAALQLLRENEGPDLTLSERELLTQLLHENEDVFKPGGEPTPYATHRIDTGNHPPTAVPPYRLSPAKKAIMEQEISKMLKDEVIEECESAWASPVVLIPKKDGSHRFCVDYRRLNAVTKPDRYPLPVIDDLLHCAQRGCYISTIDLKSSYWLVPVEPEDRDKTAFICTSGVYRFLRMPFGLRNSGATFQRLMDRFRSGASLKDVTILSYLDDLLIISDSFSKHLQDIKKVFARLRKFKLQANREKCVFACKEVKYLGHLISPDGIKPDMSKVEAILAMEEPRNIKHLRTYLQTCSWFRKFIPNFSQIAQPLTKLTKKNEPWSWGGDQKDAFKKLKEHLTTAPILIQPDYNQPFILRTDASNYAIGAVLLQGKEHQERPIEYASRLLLPAERNYTTTEREALAVVWAVEKFRPYIEGQPIIVGTDHQPLRWLLTLKSPTGRLVRWALKIQAFDIRYEYTPGKANLVADTLSRPVCTEDGQNNCGVCSVIVDLPRRDPKELRDKQLADPDVKKVIDDLESLDELNSRKWSERGYLMNQGVLYRHNPDSEAETAQLVIPQDLKPEILKECHDSELAGHPGVDRMYYKMSQLYYFPGMKREIADYVRVCVDCQRYKAANVKPAGLLQTPVMNQRNEVIAVDLFGPLPSGENGERWVLLVEDTATRFVELYALQDATSEACAQTLIEEYFLRYGLPRRVISDNGVQFISGVMQQVMYVMGIQQNLIPLYHAEANPAERKNRDLKVHLSQLVGDNHPSWPKKLPVIRYAMNSAVCRTTGVTPAYLMFGREMRSPTEVRHDLRAVIEKENFVPQITPYLKKFASSLSSIRERVEVMQDQRKAYADQSRRPAESFEVGDEVLLNTHILSQAAKGLTSKFTPKRDGPYVINKKISPTTYNVAPLDKPQEPFGKYHVRDLTRFNRADGPAPAPVYPKRSRGRPKNGENLVQAQAGVPSVGPPPGL